MPLYPRMELITDRAPRAKRRLSIGNGQVEIGEPVEQHEQFSTRRG